jgi:very-short-patch-repair endonuclease
MANEIARALRKRMTLQETRLWSCLRDLREHGYHFRRQVPIGPYIVDFAEKTASLAIEVDGSQHGEKEHAERDEKRDAHLKGLGYAVLRIWNSEINESLDGAVRRIMDLAPGPQLPRIIRRPHQARSAPPSPQAEEG